MKHGLVLDGLLPQVNPGRSELSRGRAGLEQPVDLLQATPFTVGHEEPNKDDGQSGDRAKDDADLGAQVGVGRVQQVRQREADGELRGNVEHRGRPVYVMSLQRVLGISALRIWAEGAQPNE
jgi:hypothetical protein